MKFLNKSFSALIALTIVLGSTSVIANDIQLDCNDMVQFIEDDLKLFKVKGNSVGLTNEGILYSGNLCVPSEIGGNRITSVMDNGFQFSKATTINFAKAEYITSVGDRSFDSVLAINNLVLPNLTSIDGKTITNSNFNILNYTPKIEITEDEVLNKEEEDVLVLLDYNSMAGINDSIQLEDTPLSEPLTPPIETSKDSTQMNLEPGTLSLSRKVLANINFNVTLTGTVHEESIPYNDTIVVEDTRGTGEGWSLTVQANPLTNNNGTNLGSGLLSLSGLSIYDETTSDKSIELLNENTFSTDIDNGPINLKSPRQGGVIEYNFDSVNLKVDPSRLKVKETSEGNSYSTIITWTLSTGP